jgi:hypothetical protein
MMQCMFLDIVNNVYCSVFVTMCVYVIVSFLYVFSSYSSV